MLRVMSECETGSGNRLNYSLGPHFGGNSVKQKSVQCLLCSVKFAWVCLVKLLVCRGVSCTVYSVQGCALLS